MKRQKTRGIILVMTLMISVIVAMMLGASLALSPGRLAQAGSNVDQAQAEAAIEAGIDYARTRLQENPLWKGDLNRVVVDTPTLFIQEDNGNVVGLLRPDESSTFSQFRIRFNFYNGAATSNPLDDGLGDPSTPMRFDLGLISINNLQGGIRFVPRLSPVLAYDAVSDFLSGDFQIGPGTVALTVEGLGGSGLSDTGPGNFEPGEGQRKVARRTAEVILASEFSDEAPNAALMAGSDLYFDLPPTSGKITVTAKKDMPRTRTKKSVTASGGDPYNYVTKGELRYGSSNGGTENVNESLDTSLGPENNDPFYELAWDDIHKASANGNQAIHIPGGTYVFDDLGKLHYYDRTWEQYKTDEATRIGLGQPFDPGVVVSANMANLRTDSLNNPQVQLSNFKLHFKNDVLVQASSTGVTDFTLVPMGGTQSASSNLTDTINRPNSPYAKNIELKLEPGGNGKAALTTSGDMLIAAKLSSKRGGSLVSGGELRVDAGKLTEFGKVGLSFYSKKSMQVSTYDPENMKYTPIGVDGMFYAWRDFTIRTGENGLDPSAWAPIDVEGALVAYGTNLGPELETPGTASGSMNLICSDAKLVWDAKKLGDLLDISKYSSKTTLTRVSYVRH